MLKRLAISAALLAATASLAEAGSYDAASNYNAPIGLSSTSQNAPVNSSLRDANGNLEVVNGQITSSSFAEVGGVQNFTPGQSGFGGGVNGQATAIGNQLNVVTAGSNNIVIVDSVQTNNGDQNANNNVH
ncbi:MAG: holdfast anchoring protein HfaA [Alphaproteobacteria bacterium]|nr:holdfast anchoring protein HfaA [Alphaproteobacteria bacterium]